MHPRLIRKRRIAIRARRNAEYLALVPLATQFLAKGGAHAVGNHDPLRAYRALIRLHSTDRATGKLHTRRGAVLADGGAGGAGFVDKHCVKHRPRSRRAFTARPRRLDVAAVAVQLQPLVAIRGYLQIECLERLHRTRGQPIAASFVAAGTLGVEKQSLQTRTLRRNRRRRTSRSSTHNHKVEILSHATDCASATHCYRTKGKWATVGALSMCPSNLQGRYR